MTKVQLSFMRQTQQLVYGIQKVLIQVSNLQDIGLMKLVRYVLTLV